MRRSCIFQHVCISTANLSGWAGLRCAEHGDLAVPRTATGNSAKEVSGRCRPVHLEHFSGTCARHPYPKVSFGVEWKPSSSMQQAYNLWETCVDECIIELNWIELNSQFLQEWIHTQWTQEAQNSSLCFQPWLRLWWTPYLFPTKFRPSPNLAITISDSSVVSVLTLIPPQFAPLPPPAFTPNSITVIILATRYLSLR